MASSVDCQTRTRPAVAQAPRSLMRRILTAPFLAAVLLLGATAVLAGPVAEWFRIIRLKEALPLRKPLQALDPTALGPYRVTRVDVLKPEEIEALGTEDVISWWLEDTRPEASGRPRVAHLFVSYETGAPSLVPHTPDRCYMASGYQPAQPHEYRQVAPAGCPPVQVRLLTFEKTGIYRSARQSVAYTFFCNGEFTANRLRVRALATDPRARHAFFSKVEVSFPGADRQESLGLVEDLFGFVLPELMAHHWPDFAAAEARSE